MLASLLFEPTNKNPYQNAPGAGLDTVGIPWGYHWEVAGMMIQDN